MSEERRALQKERRLLRSDRCGTSMPDGMVSESPVHTSPRSLSVGLVAADAPRTGPVLSLRSRRVGG